MTTVPSTRVVWCSTHRDYLVRASAGGTSWSAAFRDAARYPDVDAAARAVKLATWLSHRPEAFLEREVEEDIAYEHADLIHNDHRLQWRPDQLAYDGYSAWPQRRDLTPRERDVLTRILDGWWHKLVAVDARLKDPDNPDWWRTSPIGAAVNVTRAHFDEPEFAWMRMDVEECQMLLNLRTVLTPRQD